MHVYEEAFGLQGVVVFLLNGLLAHGSTPN